jgi:hypothetical protein
MPDTPFTGGLDGGGYKIIGLWIDRSGITGVGLFAAARGATIKDLGVEIAAAGVRGYASVGGLMGRQAGGGSITNCYTTGNVSGVGGNVGGLLGAQYGSSRASNTVISCYTTGNVTGSSTGGLVGFQGGNSTNIITNNYRFQLITVNGAVIPTSSQEEIEKTVLKIFWFCGRQKIRSVLCCVLFVKCVFCFLDRLCYYINSIFIIYLQRGENI